MQFYLKDHEDNFDKKYHQNDRFEVVYFLNLSFHQILF
jgi:hypothetical protein